MPVLDGIEAAKQLQMADCRAKVIFLTVHEDRDFLEAAFSAGVCRRLVISKCPVWSPSSPKGSNPKLASLDSCCTSRTATRRPSPDDASCAWQAHSATFCFRVTSHFLPDPRTRPGLPSYSGMGTFASSSMASLARWCKAFRSPADFLCNAA